MFCLLSDLAADKFELYRKFARFLQDIADVGDECAIGNAFIWKCQTHYNVRKAEKYLCIMLCVGYVQYRSRIVFWEGGGSV